MIDRQLKEMLTGIGVLIVGLNIVGLSVVQNGGNYRGNPIWSFFQGFWQFQEMVFYALLGGCAVVFIIKTWKTKEAVVHVEESNSVPPMMKAAVPEPPKLEGKTAIVEPPVIISKPEPPPPKPPPTAAMLNTENSLLQSHPKLSNLKKT